MTSGQRVPPRWNWRADTRYIGTMTTWGGSIMVATTTVSASLRSRKRKRKRASAHATGMLETSVRAVPSRLYSIGLRHHVRHPSRAEDVHVVLEPPGVRPEVARERLAVGHQRGQHHEDDRQHGEQRKGPGRDPLETSAARSAAGSRISGIQVALAERGLAARVLPGDPVPRHPVGGRSRTCGTSA